MVSVPSIPTPSLKQNGVRWELNPREAADYLEVLALLSPVGQANLSTIRNAVTVQDEERDTDIGVEDARWDDAMSSIERVIDGRTLHCKSNYPFELDEMGTSLLHKSELHGGADSYRVCLLTEYLRQHKLIGADAELRQLTTPLQSRVFQILATLAIAGWAGRSAVSIGYPRRNKEPILAAVQRAYEWGSQLKPKAEAGHFANPDAQDGGVDVLGWGPCDAGMIVPTSHWGQAASGNNWKAKPVKPDVDHFLNDYIDGGQVNRLHATVIPFHRDPEDEQQLHLEGRHGNIIDRLALPGYFARALELACEGSPIDEIASVHEVPKWIEDAIEGLRELYA